MISNCYVLAGECEYNRRNINMRFQKDIGTISITTLAICSRTSHYPI